MAEFSHETKTSSRLSTGRRITAAIGTLFAVVILGLDLDPGKPEVSRTAAVAVLMATWWITELVPLAVTALLPVILFPLLGVMNGKAVSSHYFNHIVFLFIGGFIVALAMERWNLHRRIALRILLLFGGKPKNILLGFMVGTAFLSMWISNTASTMMMVTIAVALIAKLESSTGGPATRRFATALLLGVAYSATIGGISTLVGTPPNLSFARILQIQFPEAPDISFVDWLVFAAPISGMFLGLTWLYLARFWMPDSGELHLDAALIREEYERLGPMTSAEQKVLGAFGTLVFLWLFRSDIEIGSLLIPGWSRLFPNPEYINDGTVAAGVALLLFLIPSRSEEGGRIMDWATAVRLPWHIILLFGGGFALASGFVEGGLSAWLGENLEGASALHPVVLISIVCTTITFATELTSNTATTEMMLPILAGLATAIEINPLFLMIPVTLSCSCAFMMPVATPPNAIAFGSERLRIVDMMKAGLALNLIGAILIVFAITMLGGALWDIDFDVMPEWARR